MKHWRQLVPALIVFRLHSYFVGGGRLQVLDGVRHFLLRYSRIRRRYGSRIIWVDDARTGNILKQRNMEYNNLCKKFEKKNLYRWNPFRFHANQSSTVHSGTSKIVRFFRSMMVALMVSRLLPVEQPIFDYGGMAVHWPRQGILFTLGAHWWWIDNSCGRSSG